VSGSEESSRIRAIHAAFAQVGAVADAFDDDATVLPPVPPGHARVLSADVVVEGVDFDRALFPLAHAGGRALRQNISDLAAMGASPVGFAWSLGIPPAWQPEDVATFVRGTAAVAARFGCPLCGGDLSRTAGPFFAAITVWGDVAGAPLARRGLRPGDGVWLSRPTGGAAAGLARLQAARPGDDEAAFAAFWAAEPPASAHALAAFLEPEPELALGAALVAGAWATAAIDVSDGLLLDLDRLARASGVAVRLDGLAAARDVAAGATAGQAHGGGEEFALLFGLPAGTLPPAPFDGRAVRLGEAMSPPPVGQGALWLVEPHGLRPLLPTGHDHFA
jgi:thiamine-monophosphate kinase